MFLEHIGRQRWRTVFDRFWIGTQGRADHQKQKRRKSIYIYCCIVYTTFGNEIFQQNCFLNASLKMMLSDHALIPSNLLNLLDYFFVPHQSLRVAEDAASHCTASYRAPELYDPPQGSTLDTRYISCYFYSPPVCLLRYYGLAYILIDLYLSAQSIFAIFIFRTDVWSLGCLLFAWWFGHSPFECEFHGDLVKVHK